MVLAGSSPEMRRRALTLVAADARRFEHIAAQLRLVFGALGLVALFGNAASNSRATMVYSAVVFGVTLTFAIFAWYRARKNAAPWWTCWLAAGVDVTFVTAFSAGGLFNYSGAYETLLAPLFVGLYPVFLLLSALTGNTGATLLAGGLAALQRLVLLEYVVAHYDIRVSDAAVYGDAAVGMPDQYTIVAFLGVFGAFFGALAWLLRREWTRKALEILLKQDAEGKLVHYRKYFSASVADFVMSNPEAMGLGGVRREASVMFVDIRNFTPFAEQQRPERVVEFLNTVFTAFVEIIFRHGGTLDKFLGDGLMAVFGVPQALDDAPLRAARAAVELQACARRLNLEAVGGAHELRIGVGIAHGVVIAGNVGSPDRMEFTVIGDTVNYAARLQALCKDLAQDIVVSDEVRAGAEATFGFRRMPPVRVKGKADGQVIWALVPAAPAAD